jgi:iron-sulfur cluster assembly protein
MAIAPDIHIEEEVKVSGISLTEKAAEAVNNMLKQKELEGFALRVFIQGGGCSGYQYGMALEDNIRESDLSYVHHGVKVVVDDVSIEYMDGATIDYIEDVMGSGFKVENPNAMASCGCGSSFRTKDDPQGANAGGGCAC